MGYGMKIVYATESVDGVPLSACSSSVARYFRGVGRNKPTWNYNPGLRDMIYDSSGALVSEGYARELAESWGATWPSDDDRPAAKDDPSNRQ